MNPQFKFMLQRAIQAFQSGNFDSASSTLKRVLQVDPKNLPALHILGLIKASQASYREAADLLRRAARISPNEPSIQYNLAKVLQDLGCFEEAIRHHKKVVELTPSNPEAWLSYGMTLAHLAFYEKAINQFDKALSLSPNYAEAFLNKGAAFKDLRQYEKALEFSEKALEANPNIAEAWNNRGAALKALKRYEEAINQYDKALGLKPDFEEALSNKANSLICLKRYEEAITCYEGAMVLKPDVDWRYGDLTHTKMKICRWNDYQESLDRLEGQALGGKKITRPFPFMALTTDPNLLKKSTEIYANDRYPLNALLGSFPKSKKGEKIKVGYFSADFHNHATGYLMAELFELHDRSRFELVGFSFGPSHNDETRQRLLKAFDQFVEVSHLPDIEIAKLSRDLKIDIAVDLKGYTDDARPEIFSYRAAPIQVSYLGYPGTTGASYIDYILADKTVIPEDFRKYYSEKVVCLPHSYQVNDRKRVISDRLFTKRELGLPESGFVFCCFNNNYKILPPTFDVWMRLLKSVEGSVLWLLQDNPSVVENLKNQAEKRGVNPDRLVFAERMSSSDHLARHQLVDLFIDTWPCNAHTTASDALWAGIPLVTLMGHTFASRVAASLLNAVGLPELVANSESEYESLAIDLAKSPQRLQELKQRIKTSRVTCPLFDTPLFTKNLESAYMSMFDRLAKGLPADHIDCIS